MKEPGSSSSALNSTAPSPAKKDPLLAGWCPGGAHTYIKDKGRSRCEALDTDVREHFKHVAFPASHIDESERTQEGTEGASELHLPVLQQGRF